MNGPPPPKAPDEGTQLSFCASAFAEAIASPRLQSPSLMYGATSCVVLLTTNVVVAAPAGAAEHAPISANSAARAHAFAPCVSFITGFPSATLSPPYELRKCRLA